MLTNKGIRQSSGGRALRWRPIATAPKTGEVRLLGFPQGIVEIGFWGWGSVLRKTWRDVRWRPFRQRPTHWMPIPKPPLTSKSERD